MFERYHDIVTNQCNEALPSRDSDWYPAWRNDHYIVDLVRVLEMSKLQDRPDALESAFELWPDTSELEVICPTQPLSDSPAPWYPTNNGARTLDSSQISDVRWRSTADSERPEVSTRPTSLTTLSQASISPTPLTPNTPTTSTVSCRECSKDFTGSPQDARSNFRRHQRTSPRHNKNAGLKCPRPECRMKPPMRSDNLGPHLKKRHRMSSSERSVAIDQSRLSARRVDDDGIDRHRSRRK